MTNDIYMVGASMVFNLIMVLGLNHQSLSLVTLFSGILTISMLSLKPRKVSNRGLHLNTGRENSNLAKLRPSPINTQTSENTTLMNENAKEKEIADLRL